MWSAQVISAALTAVAAALWLSAANAEAAEPCLGDSTVIGVTPTDTVAFALPGRGWGETVVVTDSLIQAVTVWLVPLGSVCICSYELHLVITEVDSLGVPLVNDVIRDGPEIDSESSDGIDPPRCTFVLQPPLALKKGHMYFFAAREPSCSSPMPLVAHRNNPYPLGSAWNTGPTFFCDRLGGLRGQADPALDLRMVITYCSQTAVPTLTTSWGRLKTSYR